MRVSAEPKRRNGLAQRSPRGRRAGRARKGPFRNLGGPIVSVEQMPEGQPANKGPGSRPQAPAPVRANDGRQPRYRRAKATRRGGKEGGESERPGSTDEAGEPTRGTPWREGGRRGHGTAGGKDHGTTDLRYGLYETSADSRTGERGPGAGQGAVPLDEGGEFGQQPAFPDEGVAQRAA